MTTYLFAHLLACSAILLAVVEAMTARRALAAHRSWEDHVADALAAHRSWEDHVADALALGSRSRHPSARDPR